MLCYSFVEAKNINSIVVQLYTFYCGSYTCVRMYRLVITTVEQLYSDAIARYL